MRTKTLSFSDMKVFLESPEQYLERVTNGWRRAETLQEAVGEVAHAVAAAPKDEREAVLTNKLRLVPEDQREEAEVLIRNSVRNDDELSSTEGLTARKHEQLLSWTDPVTGWTLKAKPDEMAVADNGYGGKVMQIAERKTAFTLKEKHKQQLFFFGMVASLALGYTGPIKLVVRLLGSKTPHVFWYSPSATERSLAKVRSVIQKIEAFLETQHQFAA